MKKPVLTNAMSAEEIDSLESAGVVFETHGGKRVVGKGQAAGITVLFLEDGSEVIRGKDGKFLQEWPE